MLGVYSKGHIVIPHHSCTVKRVNDPKLLATLHVLSIFGVVIVSRTVNDMFSRGLVSDVSSSSLPLVFILSTMHTSHPPAHFRPVSMTCTPLDAHREGTMHSTATERSYVDLPIVGSGGSSVGGELVGWLHGVWPYNHSQNDVFFSLSLYLFHFPSRPSSSFSLFSFSSRLIVTRSPRERFLSLSPIESTTNRADNNSELSLSRSYYPNARQSPFYPKLMRVRR